LKPIYYIFGGIAALFAYSYFKLAKSIIFTVKKISVSGGLIKPQFNIVLGLQNPSSQSAKLTSIAGSVYINEKYLANFSNFTTQEILSNSENDILIIAKPNLIGTAAIIRDFVKNKGKGQINIKLEGTANIDGNAIKFEQSQII
jgi:LEA14-like dessication related protein